MIEPTDDQLMELMPQQMRDDLAAAASAMIGFDNPKAAAACRIILNRHAVDHARAVIAKWGHLTPQPVAVAPYREVADLVVWLEDHSAECLELDQPEWSKSINQAARFLHLYLRATPQPVPVSERLPEPEWPTDEELDAFIYGFFFEDDWYYNTEMERGLVRAALAKWGHQ
jgi:hypothetical protein